MTKQWTNEPIYRGCPCHNNKVYAHKTNIGVAANTNGFSKKKIIQMVSGFEERKRVNCDNILYIKAS